MDFSIVLLVVFLLVVLAFVFLIANMIRVVR